MKRRKLIRNIVRMLNDILALIYVTDDEPESEKTVRTLVVIDKNGARTVYKQY